MASKARELAKHIGKMFESSNYNYDTGVTEYFPAKLVEVVTALREGQRRGTVELRLQRYHYNEHGQLRPDPAHPNLMTTTQTVSIVEKPWDRSETFLREQAERSLLKEMELANEKRCLERLTGRPHQSSRGTAYLSIKELMALEEVLEKLGYADWPVFKGDK